MCEACSSTATSIWSDCLPSWKPHNTDRTMTEWARDRVEALADCWASIDGRQDKFRAGRDAESIEALGGHYAGYMHEAGEMIKRLNARGYDVMGSAERDKPCPTNRSEEHTSELQSLSS